MFNDPDGIEKTEQEIAESFARDFDMLKRVKALSERVLTQNAIVWHEEDDFSKTTILFTAKTVCRVQSIELLCKRGFAQDAILLLRAMLEDLITFKYIKKDKTRVKDFVDFDNLERLRLGEAILATPELLSGHTLEKARRRQEELQNVWSSMKSRFTRRGRTFTRFSGKRLKEMCETESDKKHYDFFYGYFSKYVHPSLLTADEYVLGIKGNEVVTQAGPNSRMVSEVLWSTTTYFMQLLGLISDEYNMGFSAELLEMDKEFAERKALQRSHTK